MKKNDLLFVYGTLRRGEGADLSKNLNVRYVGEDVVNGEMFNLGWYPGVKTEVGEFDPDKPIVLGDIFLLLTDGVSTVLDAYEGYPSLYDRIQVQTAGGNTVWVYIYQREVDEKQRIPSGDWPNRDDRLTDDEMTLLAYRLDNRPGI